MAEKHLKTSSQPLVIGEMKIKTLRLLLTPIRMAKIKTSRESTRWQGCRAKRTLLHCWWEYKLVQLLWKFIWYFLKILEMVLTQDPAMSLLGIYLKVLYHSKNTCSTMFITALIFFLRQGFCVQLWMLDVVELTLQTRLPSNSEIYLSLPPKFWD